MVRREGKDEGKESSIQRKQGRNMDKSANGDGQQGKGRAENAVLGNRENGNRENGNSREDAVVGNSRGRMRGAPPAARRSSRKRRRTTYSPRSHRRVYDEGEEDDEPGEEEDGDGDHDGHEDGDDEDEDGGVRAVGSARPNGGARAGGGTRSGLGGPHRIRAKKAPSAMVAYQGERFTKSMAPEPQEARKWRKIIHERDDVSSDDDHDIDYNLSNACEAGAPLAEAIKPRASPPAGSYQAGQGAVKTREKQLTRARQRGRTHLTARAPTTDRFTTKGGGDNPARKKMVTVPALSETHIAAPNNPSANIGFVTSDSASSASRLTSQSLRATVDRSQHSFNPVGSHGWVGLSRSCGRIGATNRIDSLDGALRRRGDLTESLLSPSQASSGDVPGGGHVVVIGETNRIDPLVGALRRLGRFDRELTFPLPGLKARRQILNIHTSKWVEPPSEKLQEELASLCVGTVVQTEGAVYPQIYESDERLVVQPSEIYESDERLVVQPSEVKVGRKDFLAAQKAITPASHRSAAAHARPLPASVAPCLVHYLGKAIAHLATTFPPAQQCLQALEEREGEGGSGGGGTGEGGFGSTGLSGASQQTSFFSIGDDDDDDDEEEDLFGCDAGPGPGSASANGGALDAGTHGPGGGRSCSTVAKPPARLFSSPSDWVLRPRLLICGAEGSGQHHLAPALLYALEGLPVHAVGLPSLLSDPGSRSLEEALVHAFMEARRAAPALLFLPHIQLWWTTAPSSLRATLWMLLQEVPPDLPLLLLATADAPLEDLEPEIRQMFSHESDVLLVNSPDAAGAR
eukprot:gene30291-35279_t